MTWKLEHHSEIHVESISIFKAVKLDATAVAVDMSVAARDSAQERAGRDEGKPGKVQLHSNSINTKMLLLEIRSAYRRLGSKKGIIILPASPVPDQDRLRF
jgi:hypothetical protein